MPAQPPFNAFLMVSMGTAQLHERLVQDELLETNRALAAAHLRLGQTSF